MIQEAKVGAVGRWILWTRTLDNVINSYKFDFVGWVSVVSGRGQRQWLIFKDWECEEEDTFYFNLNIFVVYFGK